MYNLIFTKYTNKYLQSAQTNIYKVYKEIFNVYKQIFTKLQTNIYKVYKQIFTKCTNKYLKYTNKYLQSIQRNI